MPLEIERKFLTCSEAWRFATDDLGKLVSIQGEAYKQGYILGGSTTTVRVRMAGAKGFLTLKGATESLNNSLVRSEYEYKIPLQDAEEMLKTLCSKPLIEKTRYKVLVAKHVWEIDEFHGDNEGLIIAEIELSQPDEAFERPLWLGQEVSQEKRYFNAQLVKHPFTRW